MKNFFIKIFGKKYLYYKENKICPEKYSFLSRTEKPYNSISDNFYKNLYYWFHNDSLDNFHNFSDDTISFFNNYLDKIKKDDPTSKKLNKIKIFNIANKDDKYNDIDLSCIPFYDGNTPTELVFDSNNQLFSVIFINYNGLGGLIRKNSLLPVWFEIIDCKVRTELYSFYLPMKDGFEVLRHGTRGCEPLESSYSRPIIASYDKNEIIEPTLTFWTLNDFELNQTKVLSHREYKEILKPLDINPDNFKNFTESDVQIIKYYLMSSYNPKKFNDICSKENILENLKILKLLSY